MTWFLPEGELVRRIGTELASLVLRVVEGAALCWPMRQRASDTFFVETDAPSLQWHVVLDHEEWEILPVAPLSPMHMRGMKQDIIMLQATGSPAPLLCWLASNGFRGIPEGALRRLAGELGLENLHSLPTPGAEISDGIALALMTRVWPELSQEDALSLVLLRAGAEPTKSAYMEDLTEECIYDTVLAKDQKDSATMLKEYEKQKQAQAMRTRCTKELVTKHWGGAASAAAAAAKKPTKKQLQQEARASEALRARWRCQLSSHPHTSVVEAAPPGARVCVDQVNGRYLMTYPGEARKSVSWTGRGHEAAAVAALSVMWQWHAERTGAAPLAHVGLAVRSA